jgi:predicted small lipoprotein YifL
MQRRWFIEAIAALALALSIAGCGKGHGPVGHADAGAPPPPPPDALRPGELAEGKLDAFGLLLPRAMSESARFPDAVFATGAVSAADIRGYLRERLVAEHVETGEDKTIFTGATVKTSPSRRLRVEVIARGEQTEVVVRDETRPPAKEGLNEEERWKELGLSPRGEPLDPKRLE